MSGDQNLSAGQFGDLSYNDLDAHLENEFHPPAQGAPKMRHPRSGFNVEVGISRQVARPLEGQKEGPAVFNLTSHPAFDKPMFPERAGQEPIKHVYRGMSEDEWHQAQQRGYIQSDQRGTIADWEGTNAASDPASAVSYLPRGERGHIAKIRVEPEDKWLRTALIPTSAHASQCPSAE